MGRCPVCRSRIPAGCAGKHVGIFDGMTRDEILDHVRGSRENSTYRGDFPHLFNKEVK